jgi:hypothetical protein
VKVSKDLEVEETSDYQEKWKDFVYKEKEDLLDH